MGAIALLIATGRTASFAVRASDHLFRLARRLEWTIVDPAGTRVFAGSTETVVFTVCGLRPAQDYKLRIDGEDLPFATADEAALVSIEEFGARIDRDDNAAFIQAAIDALPEGATLRVPSGVWISAPLFLKSRMTLLLEEGAVLAAHAERTRYPKLDARYADGRVLGTWEGVAEACYASLLTALDCEDVAIVGNGVVDGGGDRGDWWNWPKERRDGARRPRTIFVSHGKTLRLAGITVRNSPSWTIHPVFCSDVLAAGLTIESDPDSPNTDGFNPECCRSVRLQGIRFSVGDDCIAIKAGKRDPRGGLDQPTADVMIENCLMERGHGGVVIGSEMSGGVSDVTISRCEMRDTDRGLRIKTRRGRGGEVRNIMMENCEMDGVLTPIAINAFYFCDADGRSDYVQSRLPRAVDETTPRISGVTIRRLTAKNVHVAAAAILGLPEAPVENVTIEDYAVTFAADAVAGVPLMACGVEPIRHGGLIAENVHFTRAERIDLGPSPFQEAV